MTVTSSEDGEFTAAPGPHTLSGTGRIRLDRAGGLDVRWQLDEDGRSVSYRRSLDLGTATMDLWDRAFAQRVAVVVTYSGGAGYVQDADLIRSDQDLADATADADPGADPVAKPGTDLSTDPGTGAGTRAQRTSGRRTRSANCKTGSPRADDSVDHSLNSRRQDRSPLESAAIRTDG
jgi:hypothetical protein